jgi:ubiquitin conjugation factor E4 B
MLRSFLALAMVHVRVMRFTAQDGSTRLPFLRPEMVERVAAMLNYFLAYLVGPERSRLKLTPQQSERLGWNPKELLSQLVAISTALHAAPQGGGAAFAAATAADERSYRDESLSEAAFVLRQFGMLRDDEAAALESFQEAVRGCAAAASAEDEIFADVPPEFEDAMMYHLMSDPVRLPAGDYVVDRRTIERHLLSNNTCPFTRAPLSAEQLVPDTALKARIEAWKAEKRAQGQGAMEE